MTTGASLPLSLGGHRLHRSDLDGLLLLVHGPLDRHFRSRHLLEHGVIAGKNEGDLRGRVVDRPMGALLLDALGGTVLVGGLRTRCGAVIVCDPAGPGSVLRRGESGETEPGDDREDEDPRHEFLHGFSFCAARVIRESDHIRRKGEPRMNAGKTRAMLTALFGAALAGANPTRAVARALEKPRVSRLLRASRRTGVFACGKAAATMAAGLSETVRREALVVLPLGYPAPGLEACEVLFSSHPEPDRTSVTAARRALSYFAEFGSADVILCLVS